MQYQRLCVIDVKQYFCKHGLEIAGEVVCLECSGSLAQLMHALLDAECKLRCTVQIETMRSDLVRSKEDQDGLIQQMTGQQQDAAEEMADLHRSYEV